MGVPQGLGLLSSVLPESVQFARADGSALVRVSPHLLAIIHLRPYGTWLNFLPMITQALNAYREVASPKGIQRSGLRYVNHITLNGRVVELEDYFNFYPHTGTDFPHYVTFLSRLQFLFENRRDVLTLQLLNVPSQQDVLDAQLDLDYFLGQVSGVSFDSLGDWLETAHRHVEEIFEACLKDNLRVQFGEERGHAPHS